MRRRFGLDVDTIVIVVVMAFVAGVLLLPGLPAAVGRLLGVSPAAALAGLVIVPSLIGIVVRIAIARREAGR